MNEIETKTLISIKRLSDNLIVNKSETDQNILDKATVVINEIVIYGAYIIDMIREHDPYVPKKEKRIILLILRDLLENVDAISVMMKYGGIKGILPIQRTVFELYLSILFIFKDKFEEKIIAYDFCHIKERILRGEYLLNELIKSEKDNSSISTETPFIKEKIQKLKDELCNRKYKEINKKWLAYWNRKHYSPNWYEILSCKCTSIRQMAIKVDKLELYNCVYNYYSQNAHGVLALLDYVCLEEKAFKIKSLRCSSMVSILCKQNLSFAMAVYEKIVENYLKEKDKKHLDDWYLEIHLMIKEIEKLESQLNNK